MSAESHEGTGEEPDASDRGGRGARRRRRAATAGVITAVALVAVVGVAWVRPIDWLEQAFVDVPDRVDPAGEPADGVGEWRKVADAPMGGREHAVGVDLGDGHVLLLGGIARVDADESDSGEISGAVRPRDGALLDVDDGAWTPVPPAPEPPVDGRPGGTDIDDAVRVGDRVVAWSTVRGTVHAAVFDLLAREWRDAGVAPGLAPLPESAHAHARGEDAMRFFRRGEVPPLGRPPDPVVRWTGETLLVWRGLGEGDQPTEPAGARWDPGQGWRELPPAPLEHGRRVAETWVQGRWVLWGGSKGEPARGEQSVSAEGVVYDPDADAWRRLPDAPLAPRQGAEALPAADGVVVQRGHGPAEFDVRYEESEDDEEGTSSRSGGFSIHRPRFEDAARFDFTEQVWSRAPTTQGTVADLGGDEPAVLARYGAATQWDDGTWRVLDPPGEEDGQFTVVRAQGEIAAIAHDRFDDEPTRLGGHLRDTDGWRPLAEVDVVRRRKATVVATDHGVLVWGGERLRAPIEKAQQHPDGPRPLQSDGAWLDLDP